MIPEAYLQGYCAKEAEGPLGTIGEAQEEVAEKLTESMRGPRVRGPAGGLVMGEKPESKLKVLDQAAKSLKKKGPAGGTLMESAFPAFEARQRRRKQEKAQQLAQRRAGTKEKAQAVGVGGTMKPNLIKMLLNALTKK